ncbi:hypothetical protein [Rhodocyclus tenuis]|uniref:hypothetical protein n=1 Tax=Rhodocyclus tenuis TaxID=1066 RepID=UPI00190465B2|nr:hypothetical protein [Rhodocyclus tenuis]
MATFSRQMKLPGTLRDCGESAMAGRNKTVRNACFDDDSKYANGSTTPLRSSCRSRKKRLPELPLACLCHPKETAFSGPGIGAADKRPAESASRARRQNRDSDQNAPPPSTLYSVT